MTVSISGTSGIVNDATDLSYTGTLTGSTGVVNIGSGQVYKDASGNVGIGTISVNAKAQIQVGDVMPAASGNMNTGMVIQQGGAGQALNFGSSSTNAYSWINSAYSNNSGIAAPLVLMTGATERARIDSSGALLVNTTTRLANSFLSVYNATDNSFMSRVGDNTKATIGGFNASSSLTFYVLGSGQIYSTSTSITAISDRSQKENIKEITYGLSTIQNLKPVQFDFKDGCGSEEKGLLGFIAQDVEQVIPELVKTNNDDLKTLKMGDMLPVLVKAIQEQQAIITALTTRITALEAK